MAFRTAQTLEDQYRGLKNLAVSLKNQCQQVSNQTAAGNTSVFFISDNILGVLVEAANRFNNVSAELANYAKIAEGDDTYDVAAEFLAMRSAVVSARDWLIANLPQSGGYLAERTIEADGSVTQRTVTPAQTAGFRTQLQAIIDAIQ